MLVFSFLVIVANFEYINKLLFRPRSTVETRAMYVRKVNVLSRDWLVMSKIRFRFVVREGRLARG